MCINRNILECKEETKGTECKKGEGINRNILECKEITGVNLSVPDDVLIETYWNVKAIRN